jgi:hypothetical protein
VQGGSSRGYIGEEEHLLDINTFNIIGSLYRHPIASIVELSSSLSMRRTEYLQRCIIGKEFDITINIINNIVYVYKEQERAQH